MEKLPMSTNDTRANPEASITFCGTCVFAEPRLETQVCNIMVNDCPVTLVYASLITGDHIPAKYIVLFISTEIPRFTIQHLLKA